MLATILTLLTLNLPLTVQPVSTIEIKGIATPLTLEQIDTPQDIQPALGYKIYQSTYNMQAINVNDESDYILQ